MNGRRNLHHFLRMAVWRAGSLRKFGLDRCQLALQVGALADLLLQRLVHLRQFVGRGLDSALKFVEVRFDDQPGAFRNINTLEELNRE